MTVHFYFLVLSEIRVVGRGGSLAHMHGLLCALRHGSGKDDFLLQTHLSGTTLVSSTMYSVTRDTGIATAYTTALSVSRGKCRPLTPLYSA